MNNNRSRHSGLMCPSVRRCLAVCSFLLLQFGFSEMVMAQSVQGWSRPIRQDATHEITSGKGLAEKRLSQGVTYYYEGRLALSSKLIREALQLKLAHPADEAMAHQYLAFFLCLNDLPDQCEQEFQLALSGPMPIELSASERDNPAWRDIYARVRAQTHGLPAGKVARGRFGGKIEEISERDAWLVPPGQSLSWGKVNERAAARLRLAIEPWGDVYINQQKVAVSPPTKELSLAAGIYTIEIRNAEMPAFVQTIALKAQSTYRLTYQFEYNQ